MSSRSAGSEGTVSLVQTSDLTSEDRSQIERSWQALRAGASEAIRREPVLRPLMESRILAQSSFADALAATLGAKLGDADVASDALRALALESYGAESRIVACAAFDLQASLDRNPAYRDAVTPFLYFKGFQALEWQRVAGWLWRAERYELATFLQSRMSEVYAVDIHPAARIGRGVFIDHATGIVIGETAVVGDDVSILHDVTLGGTGKEIGDRHPKVGRGVLIGAGAKILGNVTIGEGAKIAAGSVVLRPVPAGSTAAGVPARIVGTTPGQMPAYSMDQDFVDFQI